MSALTQAAAPVSFPPATLKPVLIVDDELPILLALKRGLRGEFRVDTAMDGEEAIAAIRQRGPYSAIISDLRMPKQNGLAVLAAAKSLAPATTRIMLTGDCSQQSVVQAVNSIGLFRFLNKPYPIEDLRSELRDAVHAHEQTLHRQKEINASAQDAYFRSLLSFQSQHNPSMSKALTPIKDISDRVREALGAAAHARGLTIRFEIAHENAIVCDGLLLSAAIVALAVDLATRLQDGGCLFLVFDGRNAHDWSINMIDFGDQPGKPDNHLYETIVSAAVAVVTAHGATISRHWRPLGNEIVRVGTP